MEKSVFICAALCAALTACSQNPPQQPARRGAEFAPAAASHCGGKKKHCILVTVEDSALPPTIELLPYSKELKNPGHKLFWLLDDTEGYFFKDDSISFLASTTTQASDFPNCGAVSASVYSCDATNDSPGRRHKYKITLFKSDGSSIFLDPFIVNR